MNQRSAGDPYDTFAAVLAAYDRQLANGNWSRDDLESTFRDVPQDVLERLENAKRCLHHLERVWPRAKPFDQRIPKSIGRFRIVRMLGLGGFGVVYLAYDERLDREVAVKVQRPETVISPELRERFIREAKAAARLRHPHIAGVYETGEAGLRLWIASEFVDGPSLAAWLRAVHPPIGPQVAAAFMASLAEAMEYSHRQGVLHRDLKPANILLQATDDHASDDLASFTPKLIDFGLAKHGETGSYQTRSGALIGTPQYMAPCAASGRVEKIGPPTDVYGLGLILYELVTGRPAFHGETDVETLRRVVEDEPPRPRKHRPDLPADLEAICLQCLAKDPRQRYPTAAALAYDLRRFMAGLPTLARPLSTAGRLATCARRWPARRRLSR
jgi:serine/threonine protein kinase